MNIPSDTFIAVLWLLSPTNDKETVNSCWNVQNACALTEWSNLSSCFL